MKFNLFTFLTVLTLPAVVGGAHSATVDFESVPSVTEDTPVNFSSTIVSGVTVDFSCGPSSCAVFRFGGAVNGFSRDLDNEEIPRGGFGTSTSVGFQALADEFFVGPAIPATNPYLISFSAPVNDVSLDIIDSEGAIEIQSFGAGGLSSAPIFSSTLPAFGDATVASLGFEGTGITAISVRSLDNDFGLAIDNLTFTAIPLPASGFSILLALGILFRLRNGRPSTLTNSPSEL